MIGIYFSGTGNTKHCVERLVSLVDNEAECISLADINVIDKIRENEVIFLGYPTQFSNIPYYVRDFIDKNKDIWKNKKVLCISTMGAFSGDAAGCSARLLKKYGASILGGLHVRMPDAVCDSKLLKKSLDDNRLIIQKTEAKLVKVAFNIKAGKYPSEGITWLAHMCGLFGQRLWFYGKTRSYSNKLKVSDACIKCGKCITACPLGNLCMGDIKVISNDRCTMCYSCISQCPKQAITLLGNKVIEQCRYDKYKI